MQLSIPLDELVLAAAAKKGPTENELRAYAAGVMAHLAIQTLYRLEHPQHFIVTERLVTLGDRRVATISRFGRFDGLRSAGRAIAERAKKAGLRVAGPKVRNALEGDDFWAVLVYLLDLSTDETTRAGMSKKRYDILDFGPLGTSDVFPVKTALAYEIKPAGDVDKGRAYVARQTSAFNQTVKVLGQTLQNAFSVRGLLGYTAIPGMAWPAFPHLIPVGPNVLHFWLAEPGVIAYEWLKFKRMSLKRLWDVVRRTSREVRDAYRREQRAADDVKGLATAMAALAVIGAGLIAVEVGAAAGVALAADGLAAATLGGRMLLSRLVMGGSLLASSGAAAAEPSADARRSEALLDALHGAFGAEPAGAGRDPGRLPADSGEASGGTGPTEFERALDAMAGRIAEQFVFLYAVRTGQGDELLDDSATRGLHAIVAAWFREFLARYGTDEFLALFGVETLDDATALEIAQIIVLNGQPFVAKDSCGSLFASLVLMPLEDVYDSLPEGCGDDGEADG